MNEFAIAAVAMIALCGVAHADTYNDLIAADAACVHHVDGGVINGVNTREYLPGFVAPCKQIEKALHAADIEREKERQAEQRWRDTAIIDRAIGEIDAK